MKMTLDCIHQIQLDSLLHLPLLAKNIILAFITVVINLTQTQVHYSKYISMKHV